MQFLLPSFGPASPALPQGHWEHWEQASRWELILSQLKKKLPVPYLLGLLRWGEGGGVGWGVSCLR